MGAWGYGAYENDTAGDWLFKHVVRPMKKVLEQRRPDPDKILLTLALIDELELMPWFTEDEITGALALVWANDQKRDWKEPKKRAAYLKVLEKRLDRTGYKPGTRWSPVSMIFYAPKGKKGKKAKAGRVERFKPMKASPLKAPKKESKAGEKP